MRTIQALNLPDELIIAVQQAGSRKIVLVEGHDDKESCENFLRNYLAQLFFHDCGGHVKLVEWLGLLIEVSSRKEIYGVRDRDFTPENEVVASYQANSHLFFLRWFDLENYLLYPKFILKWLQIKHGNVKLSNKELDSESKIQNWIGIITCSLKYITAADWVISDYNKTLETDRKSYFNLDFKHDSYELLVAKLSEKIGLPEGEIKKRMEEKLLLLEACNNDTDKLFQYINGKRVFNHMARDKNILPGNVDELKRFIMYDIERNNYMPDNLKEIFLTYILKTPAPELF